MTEYITEQGKEMLAEMLAGKITIEFTKIEMGDGTLETGQSRKTMQALNNCVATINVDRTNLIDENIVQIIGVFSNSGLTEGFYFREKGIFATDGTNEILFSYANDGENAEYIKPPTVESVEKQIVTLCTSLQNIGTPVKIEIKSGIYALQEEFVKIENPEYEEAEELTGLTSGEKLTAAFEKLAKAVADYISHKADEILHITAEERIAWNAKLGKENIAANLTTTTEGMVLSAAMGKQLQENINTVLGRIITKAGNVAEDTTTDITLDAGVYLLMFSQNGAWPRNGLAYLDLTGYVNGSYFGWVSGNISRMLTVTVNSTGITITTTAELGVTIALYYTLLLKRN